MQATCIMLMVTGVTSEDHLIHGVLDECSEVNWSDPFSLQTQ
jgi:hypothetical protein